MIALFKNTNYCSSKVLTNTHCMLSVIICQSKTTWLFFLSFFIQGSNRLNRMNQAAKHFLLQTVENGSWVGIVDFDSTSHIKRKLIQIISNKERRKLLESLPTEASGGTSICSGTESAFQVKIVQQKQLFSKKKSLAFLIFKDISMLISTIHITA